MITILCAKVLIFQGAYPIFNMGSLSNENNRIALLGNSGCGKTTLTEHLIYSIISLSDEWMVFNFAGDEYCVEKDYFPLISGLDNYCQKYNISKLIKKTIPKLLDDGIFP